MVQAAFETTDGVTPPAQARENLSKALAPLFSGTGPGGAVDSVTATGRIVATPAYGTGDVVLTHAESGVLAGTYGSATQIPVFTVDATGHITLASTAPITVPSAIPWANLTGVPSVTAGNGLSGGGSLVGSVSLSVNFAGSGSANTVARSDHRHDLQTGALDGVLPVSRGGTGISAPGAVAGNLRWNGANFIVDSTIFATSSSLDDYLPLIGGSMSGPIHAPGTGNDADIVLDVFSTGQSFSRLALNHSGEIIFGDGLGGVGPIITFDTVSTKLEVKNYGIKCLDIDMSGDLHNHQVNGGILTNALLSGGYLGLIGDSGTGHLVIAGSVAANANGGSGPNLTFVGNTTGPAPTGGGMMLQFNSNNGLDVFSWNNTAWIRKSILNSSGMISVVGGTSSQYLRADGTYSDLYFTNISGTLPASKFPGLTGDVTSPAGSFDTTLKSIITAGGYVGSSSVVPMIRWDSKGRLTGVDSVYISPVAIGAVPATGGTISGPLTVSALLTASQSITANGGMTCNGWLVLPDMVLRQYTTAGYGAIYGVSANGAATNANYSLVVARDGATAQLNGTVSVGLNIGNAEILRTTASGVSIAGGLYTVSPIISNNAKIGAWSVSPGTFAFFGHSTQDNSVNGNSGVLQASSGAIYLCAPTGANVNIQVSSTNRMIVDNSGVVVSGAFSATTLGWDGGVFRDYTGGINFTCLYAHDVLTPSASNYSLAIEKNGNTAYLNGNAASSLSAGGVLVAQATYQRFDVFGALSSSTSIQTPIIKATGDLDIQSPLTFGASAVVMITSAGYTLPAASKATQTIMVYGESVGPVSNYLRVPAGVTWSLWARNDSGDRVQYTAGQSVNMIYRSGLLIAGPFIAGVGCDWHLLHV